MDPESLAENKLTPIQVVFCLQTFSYYFIVDELMGLITKQYT